MSKHWSSIRAASELSPDALRTEFKACYEGVRVVGIDIRDVRELVLTTDIDSKIIERVYIHTADSNGLQKVGWIVNAGITACLACTKPFSSTAWRHHCRTCGLIVCAACTAKLAFVEGWEHLGKQRVCKICNPKQENTVRINDNTQWGKSISEQFLLIEDEPAGAAVLDTPQPDSPVPVRETPTDYDLWKYGQVLVHQVIPKFVFLASRKRRSVFVNVCTSPHVPRVAAVSSSAKLDQPQHLHLYFLVGGRGQTAEGVDVYDVAVHPALMEGEGGGNLRQISRSILTGLVNMGLESSFSIMYILPDTYPYQERALSLGEQDAAEVDHLHLAATAVVNNSARLGPAKPDLVVAMVTPCPAAFYHHAQIQTSRSDLDANPKYKAASWKAYENIKLNAEGVLSPPQKPAKKALGAVEDGGGQAAVAAMRMPELNVCTRHKGNDVLVRGVLHLPVLGGYVIEAPTMFHPTTPGVLSSSAHSIVRIYVLQHPVVDDLCAMGVVPPTEAGGAPVLFCDMAGTHTGPDDTINVTYHIAVESSYIGEVAGTVGKAYDARISRLINKVNQHFNEGIDSEQFVVTPLPTSIYRAGSVHEVPLLLYEYPVSSAAQARASTIAASSRGALPLSPEKMQVRRAGGGDSQRGSQKSQEAPEQPLKPIKKGWSVQLRKHVGPAQPQVKKSGKYSSFA